MQKINNNKSLDSFNPSNYQEVDELNKIKNICISVISKTGLDLTGLTILTEAATGPWKFTPFIAAFANAKKVLCYTKNSKFGTVKEIKDNFKNISSFLGVDDKIVVCNSLSNEIINQADIVTNSGFLRPIDKNFISKLKKTAVISLMWEPWEFFGIDVDLKECWKKEISILGVNESNNILNVMKYAGELIEKILEINLLEQSDKHILVITENISGFHILKKLEKSNHVCCMTETMFKEFQKDFKLVYKNFNEIDNNFLQTLDYIIIDSYPNTKKIIDDTEGISPETLKALCPDVKIIVYFGNVNYDLIIKNGLYCYPSKNTSFGKMNWTTDLLGPSPIIELNTLGLKVGEILSKNRLQGMTSRESELNAIKSTYCLDFSEDQRIFFMKDS